MSTLPHKSIVNSILSAAAGSLLAAHSASAAPIIITTYNENNDIPGGDFSSTFAAADILPDAEQISGDMDSNSDPDFFKISSLTPGASFSLAITYNDPLNQTSASVTVRNDSNADIGNTVFANNFLVPSSSGTITGTVPISGNLIVDIQQNAESVGASYSMNLSAIPEPATATVTLLGAAAVALAVRSRKKVS